MNILVVCRLRTRSTYFLKNMCDYYNLTNHNESYFDISNTYSCSLQYANLYPIFYKRHQENWKKYSHKLYEKTVDNFTKGNFGIKLFSKMLSSHPLFLHEHQFDQIHVVSDIDKVCKFSSYDTIYFLDRNIIDSVASYVYSMKIGKSIYKKNTDSAARHIEFTKDLFPSVNSYILDCIIQQKIERCLQDNNISYVHIDYNDVPIFLSNYKLQHSTDMPIDTKYNYTNLISNCNELVDYTNNIYSKLQKTIVL